MNCSICEMLIPQGRVDLGYKICTRCGDKFAKQEISDKSKRVAIPYNKGAYQYITPGTSGKDIGRK